MSRLDLRVLSPDDWELWREVRLQALADAPDAFGAALADWESAGEDRWRQRLTSVPFNLVAVLSGELVGQASGTEREGAQVEVISMWVAPTARGAGVGDALITAVKAYGTRAGATMVRLSVRRHNARAIALYRRNGFVFSDEPGDEPAELAMHYPLRLNDELRLRLLALAADDQVHARAVYEASQRHEPHRGRFLFDIPRDEWLPEYIAAERAAHGRLAQFREIIDRHGWPGESVVGEEGCRAAWLLAQHVGKADPALQAHCEDVLSRAVAVGDAKPGQLAALRDRIELQAGRAQSYGTHLEPDGDSWRAVRGIEDEQAVDSRRAALGLKPWRDYFADCLRGEPDT